MGTAESHRHRGSSDAMAFVALHERVDGAPEGRPARMESRGRRRAATIGVIQVSPSRSLSRRTYDAQGQSSAGPSCGGLALPFAAAPASLRVKRVARLLMRYLCDADMIAPGRNPDRRP